jgi:mono/diheme cytochrome c family protein
MTEITWKECTPQRHRTSGFINFSCLKHYPKIDVELARQPVSGGNAMRRYQHALLVSILVLGVAFGGTSGVWAQEGHRPTMLSSGRVTSGKREFRRYCAQCHGLNAKGDGPVAPALKKRPTNLTLLTEKNHGVFPEKKVVAFIDGAETVAAHGSRAMPIWGLAFRTPSSTHMAAHTTQEVNERISLLVDYLKSIQEK